MLLLFSSGLFAQPLGEETVLYVQVHSDPVWMKDQDFGVAVFNNEGRKAQTVRITIL
jgi:hypothetical protein